MKYHINDKNEIRPCNAGIRECKYVNFDSKKEAERSMNSFTVHNKRNSIPDLHNLKNKGVHIEKIPSISNHSFNNIAPIDVSSVDVLDEKPSKDFLMGLRNGTLKAVAFKN